MSEGSGRLPYLLQDAPLPYCKGCGHGPVLRATGEALQSLRVPPSDVAFVTDIGCVGLADAQIDRPHTVHTTHGRSTAFATGIALADAALGAGRLKTIVMIGDGGSMIGLNHLVFGALVNADVTVLVHNNFLFGMTGGQNSTFSPLGFVTATTKDGNAVPPLDLGQVLLASRAPFFARKMATDRDLSDVIARAIAHPGFAVVEILELCTAHGTRRNALSGQRMREIAQEAGYALGVLRDDARPPTLRRSEPVAPAAAEPGPRPAFRSTLDGPRSVVLAGTAGERVQTAATLLAETAILCGLSATQKNDNPVTQGTGFSVSEVILSPREILFTGIETPDAVLVVSNDGSIELAKQGVYDRLRASSTVLADDDAVLPDVPCPVRRLPLRKTAGARLAATAAVAVWLRDADILPMPVLCAAVAKRLGSAAEETSRELARALEALA